VEPRLRLLTACGAQVAPRRVDDLVAEDRERGLGLLFSPREVRDLGRPLGLPLLLAAVRHGGEALPGRAGRHMLADRPGWGVVRSGRSADLDAIQLDRVAVRDLLDLVLGDVGELPGEDL